MKFLPFISVAAIFASTALSFEWSDDCKDGDLVLGGYPGGALDGIARCETKWSSGMAVSGIKVWHEPGKSFIRGIKLYYQNGESSETLGNEVGDTGGLEWDSYTDGIKTFTTWNDDKGESIGHIFMETKRGFQMDIGRDLKKGEKGTEQATGSGIMIGVRGFMSWKVDGLAPMFFKSPIHSVVVDEFVMDQDPEAWQTKAHMKAVNVELTEFPNDTGAEMFYTFSGKTTQTSYVDIDRPQSFLGLGMDTGYPISYTVEKYPHLAWELETEGAQRATWKTWFEMMDYHFKTESKEVSWERGVTVANGQTMECQAFYWYAEYVSNFVSKVEVTFEDGKQLNYPLQGVFTGYSVSNLGTDCWDKAELGKVPERRVKRGTLGM